MNQGFYNPGSTLHTRFVVSIGDVAGRQKAQLWIGVMFSVDVPLFLG